MQANKQKADAKHGILGLDCDGAPIAGGGWSFNDLWQAAAQSAKIFNTVNWEMDALSGLVSWEFERFLSLFGLPQTGWLV